MRVFGLFVLVGFVVGCAKKPEVSSNSSPTPVVVVSSPSPLASETPNRAGALSQSDREQILVDYLNSGCAVGDAVDIDTLKIPPVTDEMLVLGKKLYLECCNSCHGDLGSTLDPPPNDLTDINSYKYGYSPRSIFLVSIYGIEGTGMAPWGDILEEDELWAICHYIESIQKK